MKMVSSIFKIRHNKDETDLYRPINVNNFNFKYKNPEININQFLYCLIYS